MHDKPLLDSVPLPLGRAVRGLYEAIAAPETWAAALHRFARATDSVGCFFYPQDQARTLVGLPVSSDVPREFLDAYLKEGWLDTDLNAIRGWPLAAAGLTVLTDDDIATAEEWRASPYFQEFRRQWKIPHWAAITFRANGGHWCMPLLRSDGQGQVSRKWAQTMEEVAPYLGHVIDLATMVDKRHSASQLEILAQSGIAAALIDWSGAVIALTPAAEACLGNGIGLRKTKLVVKDVSANISLQKAIAAALSGSPSAAAEFVIVSRSDKRPLIVRVQSLPALLSDVFGRARALVRFFDVDRMARSAPEVLRKVLGLTEAEARLANELASGNSIEQTAGRFGISKETARTQLKAVFRKTDCRSQADLVGLIGRVPPAP